MKDVYQIFDDGFQNMARLEELDFKSCLNIAHDLIIIATHFDFKYGVIIAEILEGIFAQVEHLYEHYQIPMDDTKQIKQEISQGIVLLSSTYRNNDDVRVYNILADLRFAATKFQYNCFTYCKHIPASSHRSLRGAF